MLLVNDAPAPLIYADRTQINAVVPFGVAGFKEATFVVRNKVGRLLAFTLPVAKASPGVFNPGVLNQDNTLNSQSNTAPLGSVIQIWGTGAGLVQPTPADGEFGMGLTRIPETVQLMGRVPCFMCIYPTTFPLQLEYAGDAPWLVQGIFQINARLPQEVPLASYLITSAALVTITIAGVDSPQFSVWVNAFPR